MNICIHCFDTDQSRDSSGPATLNGMVDLAQALGLPSSKGRDPTSPGLPGGGGVGKKKPVGGASRA
ncbi:hypothetical protein BDA96_10G298200 [Sorghum bicolor]|uniref:Uncharacterized protein n=2 Tax=Sorghum bicolor TaxID=4558 RepID=A0A921Q7M5_SORBI|nr:hypothetical protein BDA96_10G298200 [Sorghum bicolor]KXG20634.1 hypothetical protein SORBI_3010G230100 [Sorghum bicolor]